MRTLVIALVALTLAGCSGETAPTGWIPRTAAVSGIITVSAAVPAFGTAPVAALVPRTASRTASLPGLPVLSVGMHLTRGPRPAFTPHDLIVIFRHTVLGAPPVGTAALAAPAGVRAFGTAIRSRLAAMALQGAAVAGVSPTILTARIRVADTTQLDAVAAALRQDAAIAAVTRNRLIWLDETARSLNGMDGAAAAAAQTTSNDPLYPYQSWHYGLIDLPRAWSLTTGSASVLVAVVDDGIRFDHPAIAANLTADGYDFVSLVDSLILCTRDTVSNAGDGNGYDPDPTIPASYTPSATRTCFIPVSFGHGLHVAGTIGAVGNDGIGVTGVNWTVRIRPVRAFGIGGFGNEYDEAQGILYAAGLPADNGAGGTVQASSGARIINMSFAGPDSGTTEHRAIMSAASAGALLVAAAGNAGSSDPEYPAAYPEVLAVAAVGPDGSPTPYSSFGSFVGIRAPGGNLGLGDLTDLVVSTAWDFTRKAPAYAYAEGTSMAAPHVSGVAALLLAQNPALTAAALRSRLTTYAVGPANRYGAGLVNAYNSLTQSHGPPARRYARLYSAATGATVQTVLAQAGGEFSFSDVEDGSYFLYGGTDESGDQQVGSPGRLWGAFGDPAVPSAFTVLGAGPHRVSFSIGLPIQLEPSHTIAGATPLAIGGYTQGAIIDTATIDVYRVTIPAAATYTFETSGWGAACGFALEDATAIGLFDAGSSFITSAGFIDRTHLNFCSRLTRSLSPGTYYVAVAGSFGGGVFGGRYRLQARLGP